MKSRWRVHRRWIFIFPVWLLFLVSVPFPATAGDVSTDDSPQQRPLDLKTQERVNVRLVTFDVVVRDRHDRVVPDLKAEDFELTVDGEPVHVDTLDLTCDSGALDGPQVGKLNEWSEPVSDDSAPRRVVLAFDYLHLPQLPCPFTDDRCLMHTEVLKYLRRTLKNAPQGNEEIMVVALDGALRVEQAFTRDRAVVLEALNRMERDVSLYAGHFDHVNEKPLFNGLEVLVDVLDQVPGSKAVVMYTGGPGPGDHYDPDFRHLTDKAALARVSFYPIDCQGLSQHPFS